MMLKFQKRLIATLALFVVLVGGAGCKSARHDALQLVEDPDTGFSYGSRVSGTILTDAALFPNRKMKISIRNTSGDRAFQMHGFRSSIEDSFAAKGYEITSEDDFGLKVDVNVTYSGHIESNTVREFASLGATTSELFGPEGRTKRQANQDRFVGASIGGIVGAFVTDDTYIVRATVQIGVRDKVRAQKKVVTFSRSVRLRDYEDTGYGKWRETAAIDVDVYAGGRNAAQNDIAGKVRRRFSDIVGDII